MLESRAPGRRGRGADRRSPAGPRPGGPHRESELIRTLLFDLDGTLIDSYGPITQSLNAARAAFGLPPLDAADVRRQVGHGLESLIERNVGRDRIEQGVSVFRGTYRRVFLGGTRLLAGVATTLSRLHDRGYRMGVTSNKPACFTLEILPALGVDRFFGAVLGPDLVSRPKPDPEMLLRAIEELGGEKGGAAYIGDMTIDIQTARAAGLPVFVLPTGSQTAAELRTSRPDRLLERFEDLLEILPPSTTGPSGPRSRTRRPPPPRGADRSSSGAARRAHASVP